MSSIPISKAMCIVLSKAQGVLGVKESFLYN
jgi:hypothetical protein